MKTPMIAVVLLSTLLLSTKCQNALGNYTTVTARANQSDANSCIIQLDSDVDYISKATRAFTNISQSYIPPSPMTAMPAGCAFQNLTFGSFFNDDECLTEVAYTLPVHNNFDSNGDLTSSWVNTTIQAADIAEMNGTECVYLKESTTGFDQYLCGLNYGGLPIYYAVYGNGSGSNFSFGPFNGTRSKWVLPAQVVATPEQYWANLALNSSFPDVVADIYSSCGSNNKNFYSLQVGITVTTSVDLVALIPNQFGSSIAQGYVIVKQTNSTDAGNYISVSTPMSAIRSGLLCYTLGVSWDKVLPSLAYCANGCDVTFIFGNSADTIFVLKTTGIKTVSNLRSLIKDLKRRRV